MQITLTFLGIVVVDLTIFKFILNNLLKYYWTSNDIWDNLISCVVHSHVFSSVLFKNDSNTLLKNMIMIEY